MLWGVTSQYYTYPEDYKKLISLPCISLRYAEQSIIQLYMYSADVCLETNLDGQVELEWWTMVEAHCLIFRSCNYSEWSTRFKSYWVDSFGVSHELSNRCTSISREYMSESAKASVTLSILWMETKFVHWFLVNMMFEAKVTISGLSHARVLISFDSYNYTVMFHLWTITTRIWCWSPALQITRYCNHCNESYEVRTPTSLGLHLQRRFSGCHLTNPSL